MKPITAAAKIFAKDEDGKTMITGTFVYEENLDKRFDSWKPGDNLEIEMRIGKTTNHSQKERSAKKHEKI